MTPYFNGTDLGTPPERLETQHQRVKHLAMEWPGGWFTMYALSAATGDPPGSVERQVRYLRAERFGGYTVEKRHRSGGTFEYRVLEPGLKDQQ
jgi:hypothetical protein